MSRSLTFLLRTSKSAGYDLDEFTDEELEEAYKSVDKKKAVEKNC